jgi:protein-tyrosine phosphatase
VSDPTTGERDDRDGVADRILDVEVAVTAPGAYRLTWGPAVATEPVTVHAGYDPAHLEAAAIADEVHAPLDLAGLDPMRRAYFRLRTRSAPDLIVGQRNVPLEGSANFRDLGGYATADGRRLRWGRLFRSGHLSRLSAAGRAGFAALGIRTVCDFRLPEERAGEDADLPGAPRLETLAIPAGLKDQFFFHRLFAETDDPAACVAAIHDILQTFVVAHAGRYARLFEVLLEGTQGSTLLNCSAGKERTGVGVVLVLMALGVPRATIRHDFLLSARYFPVAAELDRVLVKYGVTQRQDPRKVAVVMPLLETRESYIDTVFAAIDAAAPSAASYFQRYLGLGARELARLRDLYTC